MVVAGSWSVLCEYSHLQKAKDLVKKATEADGNKKPDMTTMEVSERGSSRVVVSTLCIPYSHLQKAEDLVKKAKEADSNEYYEEALQLYNLSIDNFILALEGKCLSAMERKGCDSGYNDIIVQTDKAYSDKESVLVQANVNIYLDRVEVLKKLLEKKRCSTEDVMTREVREHGYMHSCNCSTVGLICLLIKRFESTSLPS